MTSSRLRRIAISTERLFDKVAFTLKKASGLHGTPTMLTYRGFAVPEGVWLRGRVVENRGLRSSGPTASTATNMWLTVKRYATADIPDATVAYAFEDADGTTVEGTITTDEEGYFDVVVRCRVEASSAPWMVVRLELKDARGYEIRPLAAKCEIRVVSQKARYGVISDIDDTIVHTGATNFVKHWRTVIANSAESRTAFPGVTHFYRGLAQGSDGGETNPFFYVSSSPWNLFDLFERFMLLHRIPAGPMLLKDFGLDAGKWLTGGHDEHKLEMIGRVLAAHPNLNFILIGDSGQRDGAIYADAARKYPGRILAVHLRDVTKGIFGKGFVEGVEWLRSQGVDVTVSPTMQAAADHAVGRGWVCPSVAREVAAAVADREETTLGGGTIEATGGIPRPSASNTP